MATPTPNMFHGQTVYQTMGNDAWQAVWNEDKLYFHSDQPNAFLGHNEELLYNGRDNITVFFPLCGKAVDMKRLYDLGHQIVGVEVAEQALEQFFKEHQLEFSVKPLAGGGKLYETTDNRIRLYAMDLYEFANSSLEKNIGGVWDRGSLEAINIEDREKYAKAVVSMTSQDVRYLATVSEYDKKEFIGPPHPVFEDEMNQLYGDSCNIKLVQRKDISQTKSAIDKKISKWERCVYLITRK